MIRKPAAKRAPKYPPVTPEFREQAHATLDKFLNDHPGTVCLLIAGDGGVFDAASLPRALTVKRALVGGLAKAMGLLK